MNKKIEITIIILSVFLLIASKSILSQHVYTDENGNRYILTHNGYNGTHEYRHYSGVQHDGYYQLEGDDSNMYYNPNSQQYNGVSRHAIVYRKVHHNRYNGRYPVRYRTQYR